MPTPTSSVKAIRALTDLTPDPRNANRGTPRGQRLLAQSLREFGAARSIVIDRTGQVICGNKALAQAQALDLPLTVIQTIGDSLVAVQRLDLDLTVDDRARRLALADNRVG